VLVDADGGKPSVPLAVKPENIKLLASSSSSSSGSSSTVLDDDVLIKPSIKSEENAAQASDAGPKKRGRVTAKAAAAAAAAAAASAGAPTHHDDDDDDKPLKASATPRSDPTPSLALGSRVMIEGLKVRAKTLNNKPLSFKPQIPNITCCCRRIPR
jgi:hypothetical protein